MQTVSQCDADAISTVFLSRKTRKVSGTSSAGSNCVGYPIEENIEGKIHESFYFSGNILIFNFCRQGNYCGELPGN